MSGKARPSLRVKTLENVKRCNLSQTDKDCIKAVFERFMPKKPNYKSEYLMHFCPNCDYPLPLSFKFCNHCGQSLDWGDTE